MSDSSSLKISVFDWFLVGILVWPGVICLVSIVVKELLDTILSLCSIWIRLYVVALFVVVLVVTTGILIADSTYASILASIFAVVIGSYSR